MTELKIYDSQGKRYDTDGPAEMSSRIENFFFGGVRVYLDVGTTSELVVFFRARESKSGRAEQYYAVYRTEDVRQLFDRFKTDLRQRVENEYGMTLQTTSDDVELFTKLDTEQRSVPGSSEDHDALSALLGDDSRLRVGVSTAEDALGLFRKYISGDASSVAIAENTAIEELDSCDLSIEIGEYDGLVPIGETETLVEEYQRSTASSSSRPRATDSGTTTSTSRGVRLLRLAGGLGIAVIAVAVLAVIGINAAALQGITHPTTDPIVLIDDGDEAPDPTLENVTITGVETHSLVENGTFRDEVTVTPDDNDSIRLSGETNQADYEITATENATIDDTADSADGFDVTIENISAGELDLRIAVGESAEADTWPAKEEQVTVIIEAPSTAEGGD